MNLYDIILAGKINGGGGGGGVSSIVFTATGWNELPALGLDKYFPTNIDPNEAYALGKLKFSFSGLTQTISIFANAFEITGGVSNGSGTGAIINLAYDDINEEWSVANAQTNLSGTWTDITAAVQSGASDIELTLYK